MLLIFLLTMAQQAERRDEEMQPDIDGVNNNVDIQNVEKFENRCYSKSKIIYHVLIVVISLCCYIFSSVFFKDAVGSAEFQQIKGLIITATFLPGFIGNILQTFAARLTTFARNNDLNACFIIKNLGVAISQGSLLSIIPTGIAFLVSKSDYSLFSFFYLLTCVQLSVFLLVSILGIIIATFIFKSSKCGQDPDLFVPFGAAFGDITFLKLLPLLSSTFIHFDLVYLFIIPLGIVIFAAIVILILFKHKGQIQISDLLLPTIIPINIALLLTTLAGKILETNTQTDILAFQFLINGTVGSISTFCASKLATSYGGELPNEYTICMNPLKVFSPWSVCKFLVTLFKIVSFFYTLACTMLAVIKLNKTTDNNISLDAYFFPILIGTVPLTVVVLYISFFLTNLFTKLQWDPDNCVIPLVTAINDVLGVLLFFVISNF